MAQELPKRLKAEIGGFPGELMEVELRDGRLHYRALEGYDGEDVEIIEPTEDQWRAFLSTMDRLGVWKWEPEYESDQLILDGTQWSLELEVGDRSMKSRGSNAYPDKEGRQSGFGTASDCFEGYLAAMRRLLGGRDFY